MATERIRRIIQELVTTESVTGSDGVARRLFPVALSPPEAAALRDWVVRERAVHTIEVGLAFGFSSLHICEGLVLNGEGAHEPARKVLFVVSDDGGESWSQPVEIGALGTESGTAWRLSMDIAPDGALAVAHSITVVDDLNWTRSATLQMAVSRDDGKTWSAEPIEYASGVTTDPDIAFTPEGELLITGSIGAEEGSHPWVVHSRILEDK